MEVKIIEGPNVDKRLNDCYHYLIKWWRKELKRDNNLHEGISLGVTNKRAEDEQHDESKS
ncbi:hypothetical protein [Bacillus altitudinis]|uniref:hypothetical protein n=1 Tax=Bacillus altitudinis TaxID=293387 RepID=UPI000705797C|nr:hypothetical protein [Bacillus altitudinis]ALM29762.1 hypothetical protein AKO65_17635 [Bacillus altitudinis]ALM46298.1 hypothetical protein AMR71_13950 [Bacillus altitudinis]ANY97779.1 hypothetical protein AKO66_13955 [Bacillus altitudinis]